MSKKLKPCPFCGRKGEHYSMDGGFYACPEYYCIGSDVKATTIEVWNTRVNPQLTAANALVDRLENYLDGIVKAENIVLTTMPPQNAQTFNAKQALAEIQQFKQGGK
jgi:hypothetical protein